MNKLYLAYLGTGGHMEEPSFYVMAPDEQSALQKAFEVAQDEWEKGKLSHERFYRDVLKSSKVPDYEKRYPKPDINKLYVYHPEDQIHTV